MQLYASALGTNYVLFLSLAYSASQLMLDMWFISFGSIYKWRPPRRPLSGNHWALEQIHCFIIFLSGAAVNTSLCCQTVLHTGIMPVKPAPHGFQTSPSSLPVLLWEVGTSWPILEMWTLFICFYSVYFGPDFFPYVLCAVILSLGATFTSIVSSETYCFCTFFFYF